MGLNQAIKEPTREDKILDLLFTSEDIISNIVHKKHGYISDHDTLIVQVDLEVPKDDNTSKVNYCTTDIPLYKTDHMSEEQIARAREF